MRRPVLPVVLVLLLLGLGGTALRSWTIGYPLVPRITEQVWRARLTIHWDPGQAPVRVAIPRESAGQHVQDERFLSGPLDMGVLLHPDGTRRAWWNGDGATTASYEATILVGQSSRGRPAGLSEARAGWRSLEGLALPLRAAATRLAAGLAAQAARGCFDRLIAAGGATDPLAADAALLRAGASSPAEAVVHCWRAAGLTARVVQAWPLAAGFHTEPVFLADLVEGAAPTLADPVRGQFATGAGRWLVWTWGSLPLAAGRDGAAAGWRVELVEDRQTLWAQFFRRTADRQAVLATWSLYALPAEVQEVFRVLLVVPVGALIVAILRNVVGFATFGTFMPILIAIAFRQTTLLYGLVLFGLVVAAAYAARRGIDRFKLLLVPRLAAILTVVILCLALLAVAGTHLGLRQVVAVGLLPMVILTMTVERFHVLTEEAGARAALRAAASTAGVAAITYALISWEYLQLVLFTYPELLLVVAAGQLALGRYVGFRVTELWRFRELAGGGR